MSRNPNSSSPASLQIRLGAAVKARRQELNLTQEELAWRANMHRTYLADIERGVRNVTLRTLGTLADALRTSLSVLLAGSARDASGGAAAVAMAGAGEIIVFEADAVQAQHTTEAIRRAGVGNPIRALHEESAVRAWLGASGDDPVPGLIILRSKLPGIPGEEFTRRLRAHPRLRHVPVVVLAASQHDSAARDARRQGVEHAIVKPVNLEKFIRTTRELGLRWTVAAPALESGDARG